jgi:4'-phosphopantetheinyl transferase
MDSVQWSRPKYPVVLAQGELHVWRGWLNVEAAEIDRYSSLLSEDETARAARFVFPHDRSHFIAGRGLLRDLLGMYLRSRPEKLRFKTGPFGKLLLADHPKLRFNLSHSYGLVLYAFALERKLGIDAEKIRPEFATEEIAERYFSLAEQHELRALPTELRTEAFFLCWTRKEAYVNAHGDGLQIPLDSFDVSLTPGQPETLRSHDGNRWVLQSFTPAPGYAAAILAEGHPESMRFWDLPPRFLTQES